MSGPFSEVLSWETQIWKNCSDAMRKTREREEAIARHQASRGRLKNLECILDASNHG